MTPSLHILSLGAGPISWKAYTPEQRFWSRVTKHADGCWLWSGATSKNGYGQIAINHRQVGVHRFSYELHREPIPAGLELDHLCRNRACVNPDHLEAVSHAENMRRGASPAARAFRQHQHEGRCSGGHPITAETWDSDKRRCRICHKEKSLAAYYAKRVLHPRPSATHCKRGHEFTPENTQMTPKQRVCRACQRERYHLRRARQMGEAIHA